MGVSKTLVFTTAGILATAALSTLYVKRTCPNFSMAQWMASTLPFSFSTFLRQKSKVPALSPEEFRSFTVLANEKVSHNTRLIRVGLPESAETFGLPVASCVMTRVLDPAGEPDKFITRHYTPVTTEAESQRNRHVDFIIKGYPKGAVSTFMTHLKPGDHIDLKGPFKKLDFQNDSSLIGKLHVGMIAGGTGITPMLQILNEILRESPNSELSKKYRNTTFSLLFANQESSDILCKDYLDELAKEFPSRFKVHYVLERPPNNQWKEIGSVGFITQDLIESKIPNANDCKSLILLCGPDGMIAHFAGSKNPDRTQGPLRGVLKGLGYTESQVYKF